MAPYYTYTKHLVGLDYLVSNTDSLLKMWPEDKALFDREWTATYHEFNDLWAKATQEAIEGATKGGARFAQIDTAPFDAKLKPVAESFLRSDVQKQIYADTRKAAGQ